MPPGGAEPAQTDRRISGLLSRLPATAPLALGFSGGGDSLYLLTRLRDLAPARTCHALIVDHGIRADSRLDAERAAELAQCLGATPHILRWDGAPLHGHQAARTGRYQLLADTMRSVGARHLWLAHTQDDQLETFFLRLAAGSGWRGLAGMTAISAFPLWPDGFGLQVLRPLLTISRAAIRTELKRHEMSWIDDPANADHRFARVRMRDHLRELQAAGLNRTRVLALMAELQAARDTETQQVQAAMAQLVRFDPLGFARIRPHAAGLPSMILAGLLRQVTLNVSGATRLPHSGTQLCDAFRAVCAGTRKSLNQCLWFVRDNEVWIVRDPGGVCGRKGVPPQMRQVDKSGWFDGRWRIEMPQAGRVWALSDRFNALNETEKETLRRIPVSVRRTLPVWQGADKELHLLPMAHSGGCTFAGAQRGMETGKGFA